MPARPLGLSVLCSTTQMSVCCWTPFRWNNVPCKKQNRHPGCWWKILGFLFLKWITFEAINHIYIYIYIYISWIGHHISCSKIVNFLLIKFGTLPLSTPLMCLSKFGMLSGFYEGFCHIFCFYLLYDPWKPC